MNDNANDLTTPLPCPPWCVLPAGHRFESLTHDGLLFRGHEGVDRSIGNVAVCLIADETALSDNGPVATTEAPLVWVSADDTVRRALFAGPELRQVAAVLLNAADEWDRATGASR